MKKRMLAIFLILCLSAVAFSACKQTPSQKDDQEIPEKIYSTTIPLDEIANEIKEAGSFGMLMSMSPEQLEEYYQMDPALFSEIVAYEPMIIQSNMIYLAKVADMDRMEEVKALFEERRQMMIRSFEQYLPDPLEMAQNGVVVTKGDYILLIISADNEACIDVFENAIIETEPS